MTEHGMHTVTISGSYRKFPDEIAAALEHFQDLGVTVLSPKSATILSSLAGFVSLRGDIIPRIDRVSQNDIVRSMQLIENSHLNAIQQSDALWLVLPNGYCGAATAFEIGWALAHNVPVFYDSKYFSEVNEPIVRAYAYPTRGVTHLVHHFTTMPRVPLRIRNYFVQTIRTHTRTARQPFTQDTSHNTIVAVGPVIVDHSRKKYRRGQARDILLVQTHKWGGKFSIVGDRLQPRETLTAAFLRAVTEQTGLEGMVRDDICAFDELPNSGYYAQQSSRIFVDKIVHVRNRLARLDDRAESYLWIPPHAALRDLDLEPNARKTIELYHQYHAQSA